MPDGWQMANRRQSEVDYLRCSCIRSAAGSTCDAELTPSGWLGQTLHASCVPLQVYRDLDIPESKREALPRSTSHRADTNGASRPGSAHLDGPTNGKSELDPVVLGCHLVEFWTNICLCQSLIVEEAEDDGPPIYQVRHAQGSWHSHVACRACLVATACCPSQTFAVTDRDANLKSGCLRASFC